MTPREKYNSLKIKRLLRNLKNRGMEGHFCRSTDELVELCMKLVNGCKLVASGGSMTLKETGIYDMLKAMPEIEFLDRDAEPDPIKKKEIARRGFMADAFFMSTNAITEDGILFNIDGSGNRVAALSYGPDKVIIIAGVNKIVSTLDEAILRARTVAAPMNNMRLDRNTPCKETGVCVNCQSPESICAHMLTTRRSMIPNRIHVILVEANYGF